jgi:L-lysine exporter family protein LysE/ArgO
VLCTLAYEGGRLLGEKMVRFSYLASALILAYFACYVIYQGYVEFVPGAP